MRTKTKTKTIMIMVTEESKLRVQTAAEIDNRTITAYVTDCLLADIIKKEKSYGTYKD